MACNYNRKYNGWTNHATWLLNVWEFTTSEFYSQAVEQGCSTQTIAKMIEDDLNEYIDNEINRDSYPGSLLNDMVTGQIESINFYELAESLVEDYHMENR